MPPKTPREPEHVRLDRWLWAARFFKTRSLAAAAIQGGKVHLEGERVKRSKAVHVGDQVRIRKGAFEQVVIVQQLSEHRGSATDAAQLYAETEASLRAREHRARELRGQPAFEFKGKGRPTKRERRMLDRFKRDR